MIFDYRIFRLISVFLQENCDFEELNAIWRPSNLSELTPIIFIKE